MSQDQMKYVARLFRFLEQFVPTSKKNELYDSLCSAIGDDYAMDRNQAGERRKAAVTECRLPAGRHANACA